MRVFPAHAGVIPEFYKNPENEEGFPRTRGGDPVAAVNSGDGVKFSPHTRG